MSHVGPEVCWSPGTKSVDAMHWVHQGHVLGAVERQTLGAVVVHHLWDAGEHAATLVQGVAVFFGLGDNDVNAALACPEENNEATFNTNTYKFTHHDVTLSLFVGIKQALGFPA